MRQLDPAHQTPMHKLGAAVLPNFNGAGVVDFLTLGATLSTEQLTALRAVLSRAQPILPPAVQAVTSDPKAGWTKVRVTVQPNVLHTMLMVKSDSLYWFPEATTSRSCQT